MGVTDVCPLPDPNRYSVGFRWICKDCGKKWVVKTTLARRLVRGKKKWVRL